MRSIPRVDRRFHVRVEYTGAFAFLRIDARRIFIHVHFGAAVINGMSKRNIYVLVFAASVTALIWTSVLAVSRSPVSGVRAAADELVEKCEHSGDRHQHQSCYEKLVPEMYPQYTVTELAEIVRLVMTIDPLYTYCHIIAHKIGGRVVAEDPSKWVEAIHLDPPGTLCEGGYLHGVLAERFRADVLTESQIKEAMPDFKRACSAQVDWDPTPFQQMNCFHGMGHLFMNLTDYDVQRSIQLCHDTVPVGLQEGPRPCYTAMFMHIYDVKSADHEFLVQKLPVNPNTPERVKQFCALFDDPMVHGTCLSRSSVLFPDLLKGIGINEFCSWQNDDLEKRHCFARTYLRLTYSMLYENDAAHPPCARVEPEHTEACYAEAAITIARQNLSDDILAAVRFCDTNTPAKFHDSCLRALASDSAYIFHKDTPEWKAYCDLFTGAAKDVCEHYEKTEYLDIGLGESIE